MENQDLAAILENNFLAIIRTSTIFFVAGIALFNFTDIGKNFSIISLGTAFLLVTAIVVDYFIERYRIGKLGFRPRALVDIVAFLLIGVLFLIAWIIYSAWNTTPSTLNILAQEIEKEIQVANKDLLESIKKIDEKIFNVNQQLYPQLVAQQTAAQKEAVGQQMPEMDGNILGKNLAKAALQQQQQGMVYDAALAGAIAN